LGLFLNLASSASADDAPLPLTPTDQQMIAKQLGVGIIGEALPSKPIDDPLTLFPFHDGAVTFHLTSGKNKGKTQTEALSKVPRPGGGFVRRLTPTLAGYCAKCPTEKL
jgi:hypothetical protein